VSFPGTGEKGGGRGFERNGDISTADEGGNESRS
jgi:hypothetical protein